jgi:hypothetical protein
MDFGIGIGIAIGIDFLFLNCVQLESLGNKSNTCINKDHQ